MQFENSVHGGAAHRLENRRTRLKLWRIRYVILGAIYAIPGTLLVLAAFDKGSAWIAGEITTDPRLIDGTTILVLIAVELALGIYYLSARNSFSAWIGSLILFSVFAGVAIALANGGFANCGCSRTVAFPPILIAAADITCIVILTIKQVSRTERWNLVAMPAVTLCSVVVFSSHQWASDRLRDDHYEKLLSSDLSAGDVVVLDVDTWVGRKLPLGGVLIDSEELYRSDWRLLIVSMDCDTCAGAIKEFRNWSRQESCRTALVVVPSDSRIEESSMRVFEFKNELDYFVTTPVYLDVRNGVVVHVARYDAQQP